jgi:ankyrin repeat protein
MEQGADVKAQDRYEWTVLYQATDNSHEVVVQLLVELEADVKAQG